MPAWPVLLLLAVIGVGWTVALIVASPTYDEVDDDA